MSLSSYGLSEVKNRESLEAQRLRRLEELKCQCARALIHRFIEIGGRGVVVWNFPYD